MSDDVTVLEKIACLVGADSSYSESEALGLDAGEAARTVFARGDTFFGETPPSCAVLLSVAMSLTIQSAFGSRATLEAAMSA